MRLRAIFTKSFMKSSKAVVLKNRNLILGVDGCRFSLFCSYLVARPAQKYIGCPIHLNIGLPIHNIGRPINTGLIKWQKQKDGLLSVVLLRKYAILGKPLLNQLSTVDIRHRKSSQKLKERIKNGNNQTHSSRNGKTQNNCSA